jgi:hypothetical protein
MNTSSHEETIVQNDPMLEAAVEKNDELAHRFPHVLLNHILPQGVTRLGNKKIILLVIIPAIALIMIAAHLVAGIFLVKTSSDAETISLSNPVFYILIVVGIIVVLIKFKVLSGFLRRGHQSPDHQSDVERVLQK